MWPTPPQSSLSISHKNTKNYYKHEKTATEWIDSRDGPKETREYNVKGRPVRRKSKKVDYSILLEEKKEYQDKREEEDNIEKWINAIIKNGETKDKSEGKKKTVFPSVKMQNKMMQLCKCSNHIS